MHGRPWMGTYSMGESALISEDRAIAAFLRVCRLLFAGDPASAGGFFETREFPQENKGDAVHGPVPLLGNFEFRLCALLFADFAFLLEKSRAVNEKHHVRILLDRARFPQVGQLRTAFLALGRARELAQDQH